MSRIHVIHENPAWLPPRAVMVAGQGEILGTAATYIRV